jgi:hypothetical protein
MMICLVGGSTLYGLENSQFLTPFHFFILYFIIIHIFGVFFNDFGLKTRSPFRRSSFFSYVFAL